MACQKHKSHRSFVVRGVAEVFLLVKDLETSGGPFAQFWGAC